MRSQPFWTSIPVHHIERIEIVKGSQSALYGDSALRGVIHIFTQKASDCSPQNVCFSGGTELSTESDTGKTGYMSTHIRTDQFELRLGFQGDRSSDSERIEGDYKERALTFHFDHQSEDGKWSTKASSVFYDNYHQGEPEPPLSRGNSDIVSIGTTYYMSPELLFSALMGYNSEENFYEASNIKYTSRSVFVKLSGKYHFGFEENAYTLTAGIEGQRDRVDSKPYKWF